MELNISIIPVAASLCIIISIIEGWLMAFIRYLKIPVLQQLFPGYRYLVRSHVDYIIMAGLLFSIFFVVTTLDIQISKTVIAALIVGAIYNPAGFIIQALNPDIAEGDSLLIKSVTLLGFIPATFGFVSVGIAIISKYL